MSIDARKIRLIMTLRRNGITDTAVLAAMERVPRERFVPQAFADQAYEDTPLPIGHGQTISQPSVVGYMTQMLDVAPDHRVLEIGTGCGYQTAVLAHLCCRVYSVERIGSLLADADRRLAGLGLENVRTRLGDGIGGWPEQAPFDRIMVTAAAADEEPPGDLTGQLGPGGVLIIPLGRDRRDQRLVRFRRSETGFLREELWPVRFVPLLPGLPPDNSAPASPA
jgi:protein-L-isoaspartate(D-aspartate) O-methyltransferase